MRVPVQGVFVDGAGKIVVSGTATLYKYNSAAPLVPVTTATVYDAYTGGSLISGGAVTTDSNGMYEYWVDDTDYDGDQIFTLILSKSTHVSVAHHFIVPGLSLKSQRWVTGADVVSTASLPVLDDGVRNDVTGVVTITSIAGVESGTIKCFQFDGALLLTHHATNLILPNGSNITTIAGDRAFFHEYSAGKWEMVGWSGHVLEHTHRTNAQGGTLGGSGFSVTRAGVDSTYNISTGVTTKVRFTTEAYDTNSDFAIDAADTDAGSVLSRFTPTVAGKYCLIFNVGLSAALADQNELQAFIRKNNTSIAKGQAQDSGANIPVASVTKIVEANGSSDYFDCWIYQDSGSTKEVEGDILTTYFEGFKIAE